jgi:hypothetical protein
LASLQFFNVKLIIPLDTVYCCKWIGVFRKGVIMWYNKHYCYILILGYMPQGNRSLYSFRAIHCLINEFSNFLYNCQKKIKILLIIKYIKDQIKSYYNGIVNITGSSSMTLRTSLFLCYFFFFTMGFLHF